VLVVVADRQDGQSGVAVLRGAPREGTDQLVLDRVDILVFVDQYVTVSRQQTFAQLIAVLDSGDIRTAPLQQRQRVFQNAVERLLLAQFDLLGQAGSGEPQRQGVVGE